MLRWLLISIASLAVLWLLWRVLGGVADSLRLAFWWMFP